MRVLVTGAEGYIGAILLPYLAARGFEVTGLSHRVEGDRVTDIRTRRRGSGEAEMFEASLVVDASGQGSRAPRWLAELGYGPPREKVVDARLGDDEARPTRADGAAGEA